MSGLGDKARAWATVHPRGAAAGRLVATAAAVYALVALLTYPLALHLPRYYDASVMWGSAGSELRGTLKTQAYHARCLAEQGVAPLDAWLHPVRAWIDSARCDFEVNTWYGLDILWLFRPLGELVGPPRAVNVAVFVMFLATGASAWALGRRLAGTAWGGVVATALCVLNAPTLVHTFQSRAQIATLGALVVVLVGLWSLVRGRGRWGVAVLSGLALAASIRWYSFDALFLALLGIGMLGELPPRAEWLRRLGPILLAGAVAVGALVPYASAYRQFASHGGVDEHAESTVVADEGFPRPGSPGLLEDQRVILDDSLPVPALTQPLAWWEPAKRANQGWLAWPLLAAGVVGLLAGRRAVGWIAAVALGIVLSWGPWPITALPRERVSGMGGDVVSPVYDFLFRHLPLFAAYRHPDRFLLPVVVALAALAALGVGRLHEWAQGRGGPWRAAPGLVAVGLLVANVAAHAKHHYWPLPFAPMPVPAALAEVHDLPGEVLVVPFSTQVNNRYLGADVQMYDYSVRYEGLGVLYGRSPWTTADIPRPVPAWLSALAHLFDEGPAPLAAVGEGLADTLRGEGIGVVVLDEAGFYAGRSSAAGPQAYTDTRAVLVNALGEPWADTETDNRWFFSTAPEKGVTPERYRVAIWKVEGAAAAAR